MSDVLSDPQIIAEFLTESGELIDSLERDLVALESTPHDSELVNRAFRSLHTIKGSAVFLSLDSLVAHAHAAESSLNGVRAGTRRLERPLVDLLLKTVDVVRRMLECVRQGTPLPVPDAGLIESLDARASSPTGDPANVILTVPQTTLVWTDGRAELVDDLLADLDGALRDMGARLSAMSTPSNACAAALALASTASECARMLDYFGLESMTRLAKSIGDGASSAASLPATSVPATTTSLGAAARALQSMTQSVRAGLVPSADVDALIIAIEETTTATANGAWQAHAADETARTSVIADSTPDTDALASGRQSESTIRVDTGRIESLMNLIGELVIQKNRLAALVRRASRENGLDSTGIAQLHSGAVSLDRLTGELQLAVMRTRMQPLNRLFSRFVRLSRDLAQRTGKEFDLVVAGGETEVDKSIIEMLSDPLVHLIRNAADHGIETPDDRTLIGKPRSGTITLSARHEGGSVAIRVSDDGGGLRRERIIDVAVEVGLVTREAAVLLHDEEVFSLIFLPGFSTKVGVNDFSGRGVGMDVVRANVEQLNGTIRIESTPGSGTTMTLLIPLTLAITRAMLVGVGAEVYAIPMSSIVEIVRPKNDQIRLVGQRSVLMIRDAVMPLKSAAKLLGTPCNGGGNREQFAVVLGVGERRLVLSVDRLIGQQEIVVKPLETRRPSVSGATVRDDGGVSLIMDVGSLVAAHGARTA